MFSIRTGIYSRTISETFRTKGALDRIQNPLGRDSLFLLGGGGHDGPDQIATIDI